jgi:hypothetical protein
MEVFYFDSEIKWHRVSLDGLAPLLGSLTVAGGSIDTTPLASVPSPSSTFERLKTSAQPVKTG